MSHGKQNRRLCPDPSIGVADLQRCFGKWLEDVGVDEFHKKLKPPGDTTWKTAADPDWLASLKPLLKNYVTIAKNGVVPGKKHRVALEKIIEEKQIPTKQKSKEGLAEDLDEHVRIGLSQLRSMKMDNLAKNRRFRKTGPKEQEELEELLAYLTDLEDGEGSQAGASQHLVPYEGAPQQTQGQPSGSAIQAKPVINLALNPLDVFQSVLNRPSPLLDEPGAQQGKRTLSKNTSSPSKFEGFLGGLFKSGDFDGPEIDLLKACEKQEPLNKGYTSQLQRSNKEIKKNQLEGDPEEEADQSTKKPKAKAKCKGKGKSSASTGGEQPKGKGKGKGPKKQVSLEQTPEEFTPKGFDADVSRAVNRKRYTSRAWHAAADEAKRQHLWGDERLENARAASQKASAEFERLWPVGWRPSASEPAAKKKKAKVVKKKKKIVKKPKAVPAEPAKDFPKETPKEPKKPKKQKNEKEAPEPAMNSDEEPLDLMAKKKLKAQQLLDSVDEKKDGESEKEEGKMSMKYGVRNGEDIE